MNTILLITPFFAPYSHAAVYRAHRFAKYLPRFGWKPYVLTVDKSFLYFVDNALLGDLPTEVEIIRARHLDLSWSGIRSLFEKSDTGITPIHSPTAADLAVQPEQDSKNFLKEAFDKFRHEFIFIPDRYITWYPFALNKAKHLIASKHIDVIYSTAPPLISHLIAMKLKMCFKVPWVADFRDAVVFEERKIFKTWWLKQKVNRIIEKENMEKADLIFTTCESLKDLFLSEYKEIVDNKILTLSHGADFKIQERPYSESRKEKFVIVFSGEFQEEYNRSFFQILKIIFERKLFEKNKVEVLIIGSIKRNISLSMEVASLGLSDTVRFIDYLTLEEYYKVLLSADAALFIGAFKYKVQIKLADYLLAKKPIIAFDINPEIKNILEKSGLGFFIPEDMEKGVDSLLNILKGNYKLNINEDYISQFKALNQTKELVQRLENMVNYGKHNLKCQ